VTPNQPCQSTEGKSDNHIGGWICAEWRNKLSRWLVLVGKVSDMSRGCVATHLRCGGIVGDNFSTDFWTSLTAKEFLRPRNDWRAFVSSNGKWHKLLCHTI